MAASTTASAAEPPSAEARAQASATFREAQAAFARKDYAAAAAAFEQTARAVPHPATWLNAAEARANRGDWVGAAEDCDAALEIRDAGAALRAEANERLKAALQHVATLDVRGPRGLGARIDGGSSEPLPVRKRLAPGVHRVVRVEFASGREETIAVELAAGELKLLEVAGAATPPTTPPTPTPRTPISAASSGPPTATWIALGVGAVFATSTTVLGLVTLGDKRAFDAAPSETGLDTFHRDRLLTNVSLGVTAVAVAAGFVFWALAPRAPGGRERAHFARPPFMEF